MSDIRPLELRLLGPVEARLPDGESVDDLARQSKRLALLARLAVDPILHRRESLMALLWPDLDEKAGRRALRQVLHYLRGALGEEIFRARGSEELGIDPGRVWCDAAALEEAHERGDHDRVVELYRGELLAGFHVDGVSSDFGYWLDQARRSLRDRALGALRAESEARREEGALDEAVTLMRRALELDPFDEAAIRELIALHDRRGDRARAVEAYERFAGLLVRELRVEPSAETQAVIEAVRERERPWERESEPEAFPSRPPRPLTSFVGRRDALETAARTLGGPDVRLLSLTGPPGVGKTRIAIELAGRLADAYPDGIAFAALDDADDPGRARTAIARAVGASSPEGGDGSEAIRDRLEGRRALLVLDGIDRVLELAGDLAVWLETHPGLDIVATCRSPIGLEVEHTVPVSPLTLPDPDRWVGLELPLDSEATALFLDRARAADPAFRLTPDTVEAVISIVRRLDGLPLAIELAAARLRHLPIDELSRRIEDLEVLRHPAPDRPDRHRTLEAAIRWTDDQLPADERALFHALGAFAGGFGLDAVEALSPNSERERSLLETLSSLVDHGLVERPTLVDGGLRYRMLRTTRDYAARRLEEEGRAAELYRRLAAHYERWSAEGARRWCTEEEADWLAALDREYPNLMAVLDWGARNDVERAATIARAVHHYWWTRGLPAAGRRRIESILEAGGDRLDLALRGRLRVALGGLISMEGDGASAVDSMREGVADYREAGDREGLGWAYQCLANTLLHQGKTGAAEEAAGRALKIGRETDNAFRVRIGLRTLADIALAREEVDRAEALLEESLEDGGVPAEEPWILALMVEIALRRGEAAEAEPVCRELLRLAETGGPKNWLAYAHGALADILRRRGGKRAEVHRHSVVALRIYREIRSRPGILTILVGLAETVAEEGDAALAARMLAGIEERVRREEIREPSLTRRLEEAVERSGRRLDDAVLERERKRGRRLSFERLVALGEEAAATEEIPIAAP